MSDRDRYYIKEGYVSRDVPAHHDDTTEAMISDAWQKEVYQEAESLLKSHGGQAGQVVYDIGCGSGFKLGKYLRPLRGAGLMYGVEVEPTLSWLRQTYPQYNWLDISEFFSRFAPAPWMIVCADVIEHIPDPAEFMEQLRIKNPTHLLISTPDRSLVREAGHNGPPHNTSHCREWTLSEFTLFVSDYFDVVVRKITNRPQGTMLLICKPKG
jgi:SAM-dependent methyltransferase